MRPLVSVIIPTFNRAKFLKEAVQSVLDQDYRPLELIVVDDGSTDETARLLTSYPLRLVRRAENRGVASARNAGLRHARGEFVAFLDSDDLWLPEKIRRQVEFFLAHPEAVAVQTEEIWIRRGRRVNPRKRHRKPSGFFFDRALELCLVSPSGIMLRREVLEEIGPFDEEFPVCEDYELWLRLLARYPVHLLPEPLVVKRGGHEDQLSRQPGLDFYRLKALWKLSLKVPLSPEMRLLVQREAAKKARVFVSGALKRGRLAAAYEALKMEAEIRRYFGLPPWPALK
ncbi:MAG: glycosyltransferase [Thermodesulfobacteria bacterium]|nr:glycosyltransferase [Thermodesulfobacteriota bacterium]